MKARLLISLVFLTGSLPAGDSNPWIEPPETTAEGYSVPTPGVQPSLPGAHGAHPRFAIEWWYWVGHLEARSGEASFGFQSTVFRLAGDPQQVAGKGAGGDATAFGESQLFMSHAALSDLTAGDYTFVERIYRDGWQASASTDRLDLAAGPITALQKPSEVIEMTVRLPEAARLELTMRPVKPLVSFGERGLSRKGDDPSAVSWYWTYPRLDVTGTLVRKGRRLDVEGTAWMDHEIASSQLGSDLEGWDWTAIQLDDGTEVKAYRLREANGGMDRWSACYWIDTTGNTEHVYAADFTWSEVGSWVSPETGIRYPNEVRIEAYQPSSGRTLTYRLRPLLDRQEFRGLRNNNPYWEGACEVLDGEGAVIGRAYLELAGYGGGLGRQLGAE